MHESPRAPDLHDAAPTPAESDVQQCVLERVPEIGGRAGPDPTRYGDWEKNGRCIDF